MLSVKIGDEQKKYQAFIKPRQPSKKWLSNSIRAFISGGIVCLIGQGIEETFVHYYHFSEQVAGNPTVAVLIFLSALFTGIGVYDVFARYAGAGSAVPVTGFANAIASAALEHKTEGYIIGIGTNMFKVAGPVIVYGVVAAFFVGLVRYLITQY